MLRGLFVTGTDTGVGKTAVAAALMLRYRELGTLKYWKPIQTGIEEDDDTATVQSLGCLESEVFTPGIRLHRPVAPYLAAELSSMRITIPDLEACVAEESDDARWVVEGAGGALVPINDSQFMIDLMVQLGMPVLVVARSSLGTINHTLMTLEVLRNRTLNVAGVVMVGEPNARNCDAIQRFGEVEVVGEMPAFPKLTPDVLAGWATMGFDTKGYLARLVSRKSKIKTMTTSPKVSDLSQRDLACIWHPYTQMKVAPLPLPIVRGKGVYLYTNDGRKVLDGISSWWVNIHGHSHPKLNSALSAQAEKLEHVLFAGATHEPAVALAEQLTSILPAGLSRVFYSDNGSTAVEVAVKMAWQYWQNRGEPQRQDLIALHGAYHGDTIGAMSASEQTGFTKAFEGLLFPVHRVHEPYCYRCPLGLKRSECSIDCLGDLERTLASRAGTVAAVLVEPMLQAAGGMIVWPAEFLAGVRRLCDRYDTLMIADEVLTGFGRTGRMFACEHASVSPDLMCLSKALTGGYLPLAVTAATDRIYDAFLSDDRSKAFFHGHSYTANPLACAVALASLELFKTENTLERVKALEAQFRGRLEALRKMKIVGDVRGIGGVAAIELVTDSGGYFDSIGPRLYEAFVDRGLLLRPLGSILYFMPPYAITPQEVDWAFDQIADVLREVEG